MDLRLPPHCGGLPDGSAAAAVGGQIPCRSRQVCCAALHTHLIEGGQVEVGHVQADEIRVKVRGGVVWQAMAIAPPAPCHHLG